MMRIAQNMFFCGIALVLAGCADNSSNSRVKSANVGDDASKSPAENVEEQDKKPVKQRQPDDVKPGSEFVQLVEEDTRPAEQVLCETGKKMVEGDGAADFSKLWAIVCDGSNVTSAFKDSIAMAYDGTGEPEIKVLQASSNDMFVTDVLMIFSIKTQLKDPSFLIGLKPHDIFAPGVKKGKTELYLNVKSRTPFPPQSASVERIALEYDLRSARGAGIYDIRNTEFNNYQLSDVRKDVAVGTEHMINAEKNEYYHDSKGLMAAIAYKENETYFVFVDHIVAKNRIDPARLQGTLQDLRGVVAQMLFDHISNNTAK